MALPFDFHFSQNSLQDYADCPRRFQLRYLLRQPWPVIVSEPVVEFEHLVQQGRRFHKNAQRHAEGIPEAELIKDIREPDLLRWWRNYLESPPPKLPTAISRPEVTLSIPLAGFRLTARYDLLALNPGRRAVIVDWKTTKKRPDPSAFARRLQTRVYSHVLVEAGTALNAGVPLLPAQVTMIYWFADYPAQPVILAYDAYQHGADATYLSELIDNIAAHAENNREDWALTQDEGKCRFCTYRSLCDRGILPGPLPEFDTDRAVDISLEFDFEEIEEIEY